MSALSPSVSFTINVCNTDAPFLEPTLRHMMRALNYPFTERLVAYDPGKQEGKYTQRIQGSQHDIENILQRLLEDKIIDRVDVIPWSGHEQNRILYKYFGTEKVDLKDFSGAPIYQYLYALDRCTGDYVFHADSDMLFHRSGNGSWIADGIELFQQEPSVIVTCPRAGPPLAKTWLEKLTGRSFERPLPTKWRRVDFTSTRYFLMDMAKLKICLPLMQAKSGEPLEKSLTYTFREKDFEQWNLTAYTYWTIHPWRHDENYIRYLPDLIWAVENNIYPFCRTGYQWDMRTEGKLINEWLKVLHKHGHALD